MKKYLSTLAKPLQRMAGFTMIELLIVISILGFLAVAVLAAINPVEQINRGRDTSSRSDAEQLISAIDRYYAYGGFYPWQTGASDTASKPLAWTNFSLATLADLNTCLVTEKLSQYTGVDPNCSGSDELKATFIDRVSATTYNPLWIYNRGTQGDSTYVCFVPQSKAFLDDATKRCTAGLPSDIAAGTVTEICGGGAGGDYYACLP